MKTFLLPLAAAAFVVTAAFGQTETTKTTTTVTTSDGTLTEYSPGTTFVVKETTGPMKYRYGKTVTYVTKSGKALSEADVKMRVKMGIPVSVGYTMEGEQRVISRVVIED